MKAGDGVLRKIGGDMSSGVIAVERGPGNIAAFLVEPEVVKALVERFGVPQPDGRVDMSTIIGRRVKYVGNECGFVTRLDVDDEASVEHSSRTGAMETLLRLYRMKPLVPVALLALRQGALECERAINPDPLLEAITGPVGSTTIDAVRGALASGEYVVTTHDPEDWAFRRADQLARESVVALLVAREQ